MLLSAALAAAPTACAMADAADAVLSVQKLGFPWQTSDPFLFCVYHDDLYPPGNPELGPAVPQHLLWRGRNRGADFGGSRTLAAAATGDSSEASASDLPLSVAEEFLGGDLIGKFGAEPSATRHSGWVGVY